MNCFDSFPKRRREARSSDNTVKGLARKRSRRQCRVCGCDPWPNRFFCKSCHAAVSIYVDDDMMVPR